MHGLPTPPLSPFFLFPKNKRGWGLKAGQDIKEGQFVIEYVGEIIDAAECRRRLAASEQVIIETRRALCVCMFVRACAYVCVFVCVYVRTYVCL